MHACDPHQFSNELDESTIGRLIDRLESRAQDNVFARLLDKYLSSLQISPSAKVLEVGCGTGAVLRHFVRSGDFGGKAFGVDQCMAFIEAAQRFSDEEKVSERVEFHVGDAHRVNFSSSSFDVVIAHTLISHVSDPAAVLREMARVVRPGGTVVIFDGDYASLTYAYPDYDFGREMDLALANATFNNPHVMRELPRLLPEFGLKLIDAWGDAVVEIGSASYFKSFAETYAPFVAKAGFLPAEVVESWLAVQRRAIENGTFFAACNYYTYLACRIEE